MKVRVEQLVASRRMAHRGFSQTIIRGGGLIWTRGTHPPGPDTPYNRPRSLIIPGHEKAIRLRMALPRCPKPLFASNGDLGKRPGSSNCHGGADVVVGICATSAGRGDVTGFHDVVAARRGQGEADMLLDQQGRKTAARGQRQDDFLDLGYHGRLIPSVGLVADQHTRLGDNARAIASCWR